jgi:RNA polymerase sigma-70 factor (ECF subfamily)
MTRSPQLAEDAVQEACVTLLRRSSSPSFQAAEQARNYFIGVARKSALALARAERRRVGRQRRLRRVLSAEAYVQRRSDDAAGLAQAAWAALNDLPADEREAVRLCCGQGFTCESAARVLAASKRSIESRIQRGLKRLRRRLAAQGWATPSISERRFLRKGSTS